ncbi:MAG: hypothetical protein ACT4PS_11575 [Betaproteobacteria bacterium]
MAVAARVVHPARAAAMAAAAPVADQAQAVPVAVVPAVVPVAAAARAVVVTVVVVAVAAEAAVRKPVHVTGTARRESRRFFVSIAPDSVRIRHPPGLVIPATGWDPEKSAWFPDHRPE